MRHAVEVLHANDHGLVGRQGVDRLPYLATRRRSHPRSGGRLTTARIVRRDVVERTRRTAAIRGGRCRSPRASRSSRATAPGPGRRRCGRRPATPARTSAARLPRPDRAGPAPGARPRTRGRPYSRYIARTASSSRRRKASSTDRSTGSNGTTNAPPGAVAERGVRVRSRIAGEGATGTGDRAGAQRAEVRRRARAGHEGERSGRVLTVERRRSR